MTSIAMSAGLGGLLIGSFLNVVAHRLPLRLSLVKPGSRCPECGTPVKPWHNVPVLSWLALRGRCAGCSTKISVRYPLVELTTALLAVAVALVHHDDAAKLVMGLVMVAFLMPMALIDLEHRIIPNRLTGPAAIAALVLGTALDPAGEPGRLLAFAIATAAFLIPSLLHPSGMGMGDVKLVGVLALFLGGSVAFALLVAVLAGTLVGVAVIARVGMSAGRKTAVPFGPFLALGGVAALLAGDPVVDWYLTNLV
jgi:leader peptidase (prepilin peptidase)/N-methyltransferase